MGVKAQPVLEPGELNNTDEQILSLLHTGRVTPPYAAAELDKSREYTSERLIRLKEHKHVQRIAPGLYELVDDPREGVDQEDDVEELRERVADLEARIESGREWAEATLEAIESVNGDEAADNARATLAALEGESDALDD